MLDELDAMAAQQREAQRAARRSRPKPAAPTKIQIGYWSKAENRWKTRWTTCMFRPS